MLYFWKWYDSRITNMMKVDESLMHHWMHVAPHTWLQMMYQKCPRWCPSRCSRHTSQYHNWMLHTATDWPKYFCIYRLECSKATIGWLDIWRVFKVWIIDNKSLDPKKIGIPKNKILAARWMNLSIPALDGNINKSRLPEN